MPYLLGAIMLVLPPVLLFAIAVKMVVKQIRGREGSDPRSVVQGQG